MFDRRRWCGGRCGGRGHGWVFAACLAALGCNKAPAPVVPQVSQAQPAWFEDATRPSASTSRTTRDQPATTSCRNRRLGLRVSDFDGDGRLDIYLLHNGGPTARRTSSSSNDPDGTFRDVSAGSGLDVAGYGMGVAVGDVNNDGLPDVLVTEYGGVTAVPQPGRRHASRTSPRGRARQPALGHVGCFFDYDRDGWLDLVVVNYVDLRPDPRRAATRRGAAITATRSPSRARPAKLFRNLRPAPAAPARAGHRRASRT